VIFGMTPYIRAQIPNKHKAAAPPQVWRSAAHLRRSDYYLRRAAGTCGAPQVQNFAAPLRRKGAARAGAS
jgi:hypothetical protein